MLFLEIQNITSGGVNSRGLADYHVVTRINNRTLWEGKVRGHVRKAGAADLLRKIADEMDKVSHDGVILPVLIDLYRSFEKS